MLQAERNADDGHAENESAQQMDGGNLPPARQDPDQVHHSRYTAGFPGPVNQLMAERPECIGTQLEKLRAERDTDDGNAHQQPDNIVDQGDEDSSQKEPADVTEQFHVSGCRAAA